MEWMLMPYRRYADFSGRSQRKEYWMFFLLYTLVLVFGAMLIFAGMPNIQADPQAVPGISTWIGGALVVLYLLGSIVPAIAVTVRRFHDQDKSGWMWLLNFIPYVGGLIVFVFMCLDGSHGANRFGPDPKDPHTADVFG